MGAFNHLLKSLLELAQNRVELVAVEMEEEKYRVVEVVFWTAMVSMLVFLALAMLTATVIVLLWDSYRLAALLGFLGLYTVAAGIGIAALKRRMRQARPPFSETLAQFKKDREWLQGQS